MKPPDLDSIERDAYAYLIKEYIFQNEGGQPRIMLLGFSDVGDQICEQFYQTKVHVIEPERTGQLKEASLIRKSDQPCMILIRSKKNLGKFASLVTAFKILDEVIVVRKSPVETYRDVYDLSNVSNWLVDKDIIHDICSFIESKLSTSFRFDCEGISVILNEMKLIAEQRPSFSEWTHPRRVTKSLVYSLNSKRTNGAVSVATFLRKFGIEPKRKLEDIPLFSKDIKKEENLKELKETLLVYPRILRMLHACSIPKQRTNLANLCMNHFRNILYTLANHEWNSRSGTKWIVALVEFERVIVMGNKRRRRKKKYELISRGVHVSERSSVSGLPICIRLPLKVNLENGGRNLFKELYDNKLNSMIEEYSKLIKPKSMFFDLKPMDLTDANSKLIVEFDIVVKDGDIVLDPFIEGTKSPTRKINALLTDIRRKARRSIQ